MVYQYKIREAEEPVTERSTFTYFWIRRFFRIAPLYYLSVIAILLFGDYYTQLHTQLVPETEHATYGQPIKSLIDVLYHITFVFGVVPDQHLKIIIPDWSLSLEMQFYLAFPFIMLAAHRLGTLKTTIVLTLLSVVFINVFPEYVAAFQLPSFLLLKLNMFLAGMLIGLALFSKAELVVPYFAAAAFLATLTFFAKFGVPSSIIRGSILVGFGLFALRERLEFLPGLLTKVLSHLSQIMGGKIGNFMGEVSYGVYLSHQFIIFPVLAYLFSNYGSALNTPQLNFAAGVISLPLVYLLSWLLHRSIEKEGIQAGRILIKRLKAVPDYKKLHKILPKT